jgi:mono/diheme cytochrome c family protein
MQNLSNGTKNLLLVGATLVCVYGVSWYARGGGANAAGPAASGEKIFTTNCASCHAAGGNIVDASKPLKGSKKLASKEIFKNLLTKPVGSMPPFPQIVQNDADLTALLTYCKSLK